jgi:hypothetical protein
MATVERGTYVVGSCKSGFETAVAKKALIGDCKQ